MFDDKDVLIFVSDTVILALRALLGKHKFEEEIELGSLRPGISPGQIEAYVRHPYTTSGHLSQSYVEAYSIQAAPNYQQDHIYYWGRTIEPDYTDDIGPRTTITDVEFADIQAAIAAGTLSDHDVLKDLATHFSTGGQLDAFEIVRLLAQSSAHMSILMNADIGLNRPCTLGAHTEADLKNFEQRYRIFIRDPQMLVIMRFSSLFRDIGKSYCVKAT